MTSAIFYDDLGKVISIRGGSRASCELSLVQNPQMTGLVTDEEVTLDSHYVMAGRIHEMPPKPSNAHVFEYRTKLWVYDPAPAHNETMFAVRVQRNSALTSSDWTQMPDTPLSTEQQVAWQNYRQQLRDLPSNYPDATSIDDITFPTPPSI